ncbi:hypothetical protein [Roseimaritima sediminicola]|uniref:hypothetical protein n=1 Tax=Roseimaritima sediminicola TaxID=2662066 RepID=UPI0012983BCD|nr:hypothetical protein [Roseimaritima sediminicola]
MTRITTITSLCVLLAAAIFVGTVFTRNLLHARAQLNVQHLNQQTTSVDAFPIVHSHTLVDRHGKPKIILLHKSTEPSGNVPFHWVDLIAIDPPDRHLRCIVDGDPVEIESDVQVFYALDDSKPSRRSFPSDTVVPHIPDAKWDEFANPF